MDELTKKRVTNKLTDMAKEGFKIMGQLSEANTDDKSIRQRYEEGIKRANEVLKKEPAFKDINQDPETRDINSRRITWFIKDERIGFEAYHTFKSAFYDLHPGYVRMTCRWEGYGLYKFCILVDAVPVRGRFSLPPIDLDWNRKKRLISAISLHIKNYNHDQKEDEIKLKNLIQAIESENLNASEKMLLNSAKKMLTN